MTDLVLVRHGETEWNRLGRVQGLSDIPLNETGRRQAREAGRRLRSQHWDAIAASPLARAAETAEIIAQEVGLPGPELVEALVERNYGDAEGLTGDEIDRRWGGELKARESRESVLQRAVPALVALAERHQDGRVLVVTHGGVIGSLVRSTTEWAWPEHGVRIENGSDHVFRVEGEQISLITFAGRPWSADLLPAEDPVATTD